MSLLLAGDLLVSKPRTQSIVISSLRKTSATSFASHDLDCVFSSLIIFCTYLFVVTLVVDQVLVRRVPRTTLVDPRFSRECLFSWL